MQVTEKLTKALTEAKYLNADNVGRYRCIMRIFFENYEKLHYWLYQEEIYDQMKADPFFADYRLEQCQPTLHSPATRLKSRSFRRRFRVTIPARA